MKRVYILRHADSIAGANDKLRPLSKEGHKELEHLKLKAIEVFKSIDMVLCSGSTRTRETLTEVSNCLPDRVMIHYLDSLYHASPETILQEIGLVDNRFNAVFVVAHNPGVTEFLQYVCKQQGEPMDKSMKTGSLAEFIVKGESWHGLNYADFKFIRLIRA